MMKSSEKQAKELLRRAWIVLDLVEPNDPITDQALEFLIGSEHTDLDRLVERLEGHVKRAVASGGIVEGHWADFCNWMIKDIAEFGAGEGE